MQWVVDTVLGNAREALKTLSREAISNTAKLINGVSALVIGVLPHQGGRPSSLWETYVQPRMPRWMEQEMSSFNQFIHDYAVANGEVLESEGEGEEQDLMPGTPRSLSSMSSGRHRAANRGFLYRILLFIRWLFAPVLPPLRNRGRLPEGAGSFPMSSGYSTPDRTQGSMGRRMSEFWESAFHMNFPVRGQQHGIIEDLQFQVERVIDWWFEMARSVLFYVVTPWEAARVVWRRLSSTGTFAPSPMALKSTTEATAVEQIITDAGYPYDCHRVVTGDGYVLRLERIPRRGARKVVFLQHGLLDSSLGWVANGVVGSQAFAAYDEGFDVFLGNFRGYTTREHINPHISSRKYWDYTMAEHGEQDIAAMVKRIHELKMAELSPSAADNTVPPGGTTQEPPLPYSLAGVAHSLGGGAMLIYVVTRRLLGLPHRFSRLILLSPAGFHEQTPFLFDILQYVSPVLKPFMRRFMPGFFIPTRALRHVFSKLIQDFHSLPAVKALAQVVIRTFFTGGDSSDWIDALRMPHYGVESMPGISYMVADHLRQTKQAKRFVLYDYGRKENLKRYGAPRPLDIGANYNLIDIPVDLVVGSKDGLIAPQMILKHYMTMRAAGVPVSIREFEYAHLDFTFAHKQELMAYVMSLLALSAAPVAHLGQPPKGKTSKGGEPEVANGQRSGSSSESPEEEGRASSSGRQSSETNGLRSGDGRQAGRRVSSGSRRSSGKGTPRGSDRGLPPRFADEFEFPVAQGASNEADEKELVLDRLFGAARKSSVQKRRSQPPPQLSVAFRHDGESSVANGDRIEEREANLRKST